MDSKEKFNPLEKFNRLNKNGYNTYCYENYQYDKTIETIKNRNDSKEMQQNVTSTVTLPYTGCGKETVLEGG